MQNERYRIEYDNDTGPDDEGYREWWMVIRISDGRKLCECDTEEDANTVKAALEAAHEPR